MYAARLVDDFAQRRFDDEHPFFGAASASIKLWQDRLERVTTVAEVVHRAGGSWFSSGLNLIQGRCCF
jgi:hypothetical protein